MARSRRTFRFPVQGSWRLRNRLSAMVSARISRPDPNQISKDRKHDDQESAQADLLLDEADVSSTLMHVDVLSGTESVQNMLAGHPIWFAVPWKTSTMLGACAGTKGPRGRHPAWRARGRHPTTTGLDLTVVHVTS